MSILVRIKKWLQLQKWILSFLLSIYPRVLQFNKANTSDKETYYLDLNITAIGNNIQTSVYDKRDDFGFPIVYFKLLSGDVPRLLSYGIYISQLVRLARCCTGVFDFHSKNLQIISKLLTQGYRFHKLRKRFWKFFRSYSEHMSKCGAISFQDRYILKFSSVKRKGTFVTNFSKMTFSPILMEQTFLMNLIPRWPQCLNCKLIKPA